jgi:hypothetical protein
VSVDIGADDALQNIFLGKDPDGNFFVGNDDAPDVFRFHDLHHLKN